MLDINNTKPLSGNLCLTGDKTCFCKQCVGSYCNHSPMFETAYFTTLFQRGIGQNFLFSTRWLVYAIRALMGDMTVISDVLFLGKHTDNTTSFSWVGSWIDQPQICEIRFKLNDIFEHIPHQRISNKLS